MPHGGVRVDDDRLMRRDRPHVIHSLAVTPDDVLPVAVRIDRAGYAIGELAIGEVYKMHPYPTLLVITPVISTGHFIATRRGLLRVNAPPRHRSGRGTDDHPVTHELRPLFWPHPLDACRPGPRGRSCQVQLRLS